MKRVGTFSVLVLLILCLVATPTIQAAKPLEKLVDIEHYDDPDKKGILKATVIFKSIEGEYAEVSASVVISMRLYSEGDYMGHVKLTMTYSGTSWLPGGGIFGTPYTGRLVYSLVAPEWFPEESRHLVMWFDEGEVTNQIGEGEPWFP